MVRKVIYPAMAFAALALAFSFNGCSCHAEMGDQQAKTAPPPPPPPEPAPPPAPAPAPEPPKKELQPVGKAQIEGDRIKIPGELEFDVDKATIKDTAQSKEILNTLLEFMQKNPSVTKLRVEGHTDNSGTPDHNQKLSDDRAAAVAKWLVDKGIDKGRLHTVGFGQTHPIVDNNNPENKAKNRRTEFHVEEQDGKPLNANQAAAVGAGGSANPADAGAPAAPSAGSKAMGKMGGMKH